jgi:hypothetical protein
MLKLLADENFDNRILRGLQRRLPEVDIIRVQDTALYSSDDPSVLAWAAEEERLILTHDVETMVKYAYEFVRAGQNMAGVLEVSPHLPIGRVIEDLVLIVTASSPPEWFQQVRYLPL